MFEFNLINPLDYFKTRQADALAMPNQYGDLAEHVGAAVKGFQDAADKKRQLSKERLAFLGQAAQQQIARGNDSAAYDMLEKARPLANEVYGTDLVGTGDYRKPGVLKTVGDGTGAGAGRDYSPITFGADGKASPQYQYDRAALQADANLYGPKEKPIEVSEGASLMSNDGRVLGTAPSNRVTMPKFARSADGSLWQINPDGTKEIVSGPGMTQYQDGRLDLGRDQLAETQRHNGASEANGSTSGRQRIVLPNGNWGILDTRANQVYDTGTKATAAPRATAGGSPTDVDAKVMTYKAKVRKDLTAKFPLGIVPQEKAAELEAAIEAETKRYRAGLMAQQGGGAPAAGAGGKLDALVDKFNTRLNGLEKRLGNR